MFRLNKIQIQNNISYISTTFYNFNQLYTILTFMIMYFHNIGRLENKMKIFLSISSRIRRNIIIQL